MSKNAASEAVEDIFPNIDIFDCIGAVNEH